MQLGWRVKGDWRMLWGLRNEQESPVTGTARVKALWPEGSQGPGKALRPTWLKDRELAGEGGWRRGK